MKRILILLILILLILLLSSPAPAGNICMMGGGGGGGTCSTYTEQFVSVASTDEIQSLNATNAAGSSFKVTGNGYIHSIKVWVWTDTAQTMTLRWGNSHDLSTYYKEVTANTTNAGTQQVTFVLQDTDNQATTDTTYYWAIIAPSAANVARLAPGGTMYADGGDLYPGTGWHTDETTAATYDIRFAINICD